VSIGRLILGIAALLLALASAPAASGATFNVNSTGDAHDADEGDGQCETTQGKCTLRAAVDEANFAGDPDKVKLKAERYVTTGEREDLNDSGDYDLVTGSELKVTGAGMDRTTIDGDKIDRLFQVPQGARLDLQKLTLTRGAAQFAGGGVVSSGVLTLDRVGLVKNNGGDGGGGIASTGTLQITSSLISRNKASQTAGGISVSGLSPTFPGTFIVEGTTFSRNEGGGSGGGMFVSGDEAVTRIVANSTFDRNTAGQAGAIESEASETVGLLHVTVTRNSSGSGGQVFADGPIRVGNSLFGLTDGPGEDCAGLNIISAGFNLDDDGSCASEPSDQTRENPKVGRLRQNGGDTPTVALKRKSPARNAIDKDDPECLETDQRGVKRPQGNRCDIGAFEFEQ
jgi:CSLREA domain-containing protein